MLIKTKKSPNFSKKVRKNKDIKFLIIHYTGMQSRIESINRLIDPKSKVSCHYLIDRKGKILKMVNEDRVAWHAGKSKWKNFVNLNKYSIGIELVNKGHAFGYEKFNKLQIGNLIKLCIQLKKKYKIKNSNILGHSDIAPLRKQDPGEKFPWQKLNKNDLGIWCENSIIKKKKTYKKNKKNIFFRNLYKIGYRYFNKNKRLKKDVTIVKAFQRRFLPNKITGIIDQKTFIISHFLANLRKI
jgi:N-acetylmuramoyl-L-alanine amidase